MAVIQNMRVSGSRFTTRIFLDQLYSMSLTDSSSKNSVDLGRINRVN